MPMRIVEKYQRRSYGRKTCESKKRFKYRNDAWKFALNINKVKGGNLSAYKCHYCEFFHLTSKYNNVPPKSLR